MLPTDQNLANNNVSRLLSSCSHLPIKEAYEKIVSFLKNHYDPRVAKNLPALFSAISQIVSAFGGRDLKTMAAQNAIMSMAASVSTLITKFHQETSPLNTNPTGAHTSYNSAQGVQMGQIVADALEKIESAGESSNIVVRSNSEQKHSTPNLSRASSSSTVSSKTRINSGFGWREFDRDPPTPNIVSNESLQHPTILQTFNIPTSNNLRELCKDITKERFFDLMLFAIACGYKYAGGPTLLSAESTNALVWDLLSASQQGLAQALSYIMYRNYAWTITVLCSMATQVIELMNKTPDASTKAIIYAAMLGMVVGTSMIAINYMEREAVLTAGTAKRPNQEATENQREEQSDAFRQNLNSWEKTGSYPGGTTACQDPGSKNKDMYSGHVSTLVIQAYSMYQLSKSISERYPENPTIKYLSRAFFAIGCASLAGETIATVLGDCHTLESVAVASTKFNSSAILAKFLSEVLDLAITNPQMFVTTARTIWDGLSKRNNNSLTNNMALSNERQEDVVNPVTKFSAANTV